MCATSRMGHWFPQASGDVVANTFVGFVLFPFCAHGSTCMEMLVCLCWTV